MSKRISIDFTVTKVKNGYILDVLRHVEDEDEYTKETEIFSGIDFVKKRVIETLTSLGPEVKE